MNPSVFRHFFNSKEKGGKGLYFGPRAAVWLGALGLAMLAGCGDPGGLMTTFNSLQDEIYECDFAENQGCSEQSAPNPGALPLSGAATYDGVVSLSVQDRDSAESIHDVIGALSVDVTFDAQGGDMSGTADGFYKSDGSGEAVGGTLEVTNTVLDRSGTLYVGDDIQYGRTDLSVVGNIDGDLEIDGDTLAVDAALGGFLFGDSAELVDAEVSGEGLLGEAQTAVNVYGQIYLKTEE